MSYSASTNGLARVAAFEFGERGRVLADFFRELEKDAAAVLRGSLRPGAGIESVARGSDGAIDVGGVSRGDVGDHFFGGGIVDGKCFAGGSAFPLTVDEILIGADSSCCCTTGHINLPTAETVKPLL
jgi:hypothetical protein